MKIRISKTEILNKFECPKFEYTKPDFLGLTARPTRTPDRLFAAFGVWFLYLFHISCFGFRISAVLNTALLVGFLPPARAADAAGDPPRPNFVIIFTDDQCYNDLGCFGSSKIKTPNIDRMAHEGMRLTIFYAQAVCGPSRAALMTGWSGRFHRNGVRAAELYDLIKDPGETHCVADQKPAVVERLTALVDAARRDLGDYNRIGDGARFFDTGSKRPNIWKGQQ
jgi:hypothetical protein